MMDDPGAANVKSPSGLTSVVSVPRLKTIARIPTGKKVYHQQPQYTGGPGAPPQGFVVGQTSASEWNVYWALAKVLKEPMDPRQPPFVGGPPYWAYQVPYLGAYTRAPGSAVVDFVVYQGSGVNGAVAMRLQTLRYHYLTDAAKQAFDLIQLTGLLKVSLVVDLVETDFLGDATGAKYVANAKKGLNLIQTLSPIYGGTDPRRKIPVSGVQQG